MVRVQSDFSGGALQRVALGGQLHGGLLCRLQHGLNLIGVAAYIHTDIHTEDTFRNNLPCAKAYVT